jgi:hypothetical protein
MRRQLLTMAVHARMFVASELDGGGGGRKGAEVRGEGS